MSCYSCSDEGEVCEVCGAPANPFYRTRIGQHCCSFKCSCIDTRVERLFAAFIFFVISVAVVVLFTIFGSPGVTIIAPILSLLLAVGMLASSIYGFKKYKETIHQTNEIAREEIETRPHLNRRYFNYKPSGIGIERVRERDYYNGVSQQYIGPIIYTKSSGSFICAICKIKLKEPEEYYQCSICLSAFHTKHLTEWLQIKKVCPVCKSKG